MTCHRFQPRSRIYRRRLNNWQDSILRQYQIAQSALGPLVGGLVVTPAVAITTGMAGPGAGAGAARDSGNQSRPPSSGDAPGPDDGGEARGDGVGLLGAMRRLALVMARGPDDGGVAYPE
ncbi:hypothetical protein Vretimale_8945 [Volvox reticuliferus]|uniref:Uncharacterized protein n=1 Tax=Volvox reticuliferus TaxID=1737510 RepID=A0A8J4LPV0_9CHLO|nr:hypothetical protein Vretifemale_14392 [Volvox reticuliferus]GIM04356.1 hypothetical protein Vretimale_8945 [Volvox reticuliferus]